MPYIDADPVDGLPPRRWVNPDRDAVIGWRGDPYRLAAEQFAKDVESFLYDFHCPEKYRRPEFLMWAVARYDATKTGSGRYVDFVDYTPDQILDSFKEPLPEPEHRTTPGPYMEIDLRYPAHAREALAKETE